MENVTVSFSSNKLKIFSFVFKLIQNARQIAIHALTKLQTLFSKQYVQQTNVMELIQQIITNYVRLAAIIVNLVVHLDNVLIVMTDI